MKVQKGTNKNTAATRNDKDESREVIKQTSTRRGEN